MIIHILEITAFLCLLPFEAFTNTHIWRKFQVEKQNMLSGTKRECEKCT